MTDESKFDDDELAEAEALARALEHGHAPPSNVDDAVDAAEVVRMLKAPVLSEDRLEATLAETERRIAAARRRTRTRLFAIGTAGSALALAAAALLIVRAPRMEPAQHSAAPRAAPIARQPLAPASPEEPARAATAGAAQDATKRLRQAQVAWLVTSRPTAAARDELQHALLAYRELQLNVLERRYAR